MKNIILRKKPVLLFILIIILCGNLISNMVRWSKNEIIERPMKADLIQRIGSDKENEEFFHPRSFAVDSGGRILILDSGNSRIQGYSRDGKFLSSFGKFGQGPGELSKNASKIKILDDGNIYVIDNSQRKINVYTLDGKFIHSFKAPSYCNDLVLINKKYYISGILLKDDSKPVNILNESGKTESSFGIFIDPAVGLSKQINQLAIPDPWRMMFSDSNFTNILTHKKSEIIFSQTAPYRLVQYDSEGRVIKDVIGDVDFDTHMHVKITIRSANEVSVSSPKPSCSVFQLSPRSDGGLVVPYINSEKNILFYDFYDQDLNFIKRYKMSNVLCDARKKENISQIFINKDDYLYALISSQEDYSQVVKYKLVFD